MLNHHPAPAHFASEFSKPMSQRPRRFSVVLLILVLIGCGLGWWYRHSPATAPTPAAKGEAKAPLMAVRTEPVRQGDFSLYLNALGNVIAFNTTTVKTRVAGELIKIHFREGQMVKQGDLLADIDPRMYQAQLGQAEGKLAGDQAQLEYARFELTRDQNLVKKGYIALAELQTQTAAVHQLEAAIATDQAQLDAARLQLSFCRVTAPLSGRIGLKMVDLGNILNAMDPLVLITQLQPVAVLFSIPQDHYPRLQRRMKDSANLLVEAWDRDRKQRLAVGQLLTADNLIDSTTGTLRLKAVFDNRDNRLFPNQFVNIRLLLEVRPRQLLVPRAAVQQGPDGSQVFVIQPDSTATLRRVLVGPSEGDVTVIESGLNAGETVVTDGLDKLREGTKVRPPDATGGAAGGPARQAP